MTMNEHTAPPSATHADRPANYVSFLGIPFRREYVMVLIVLSVFTLAEVGITYTHIDRRIMRVLLVGMAVTKAAFVGLYYMHLKYEKRSLLWLAFIPLPLAGAYAIFLLLDAQHLLRGVSIPWLKLHS
jgi:caa(3)-type oxidase subunit IV